MITEADIEFIERLKEMSKDQVRALVFEKSSRSYLALYYYRDTDESFYKELATDSRNEEIVSHCLNGSSIFICI